MRRIKYLAIIGMLAIALAGCGKQESSKEENKVTNTPTPTAMPTFTPTPTPVQDKLIDLTEEEIEEVFEIRNSYFDLLVNEETGGIQNYYTCELVAYYKYIGLGDFELPVTVNYTEEEAEAKFGGDWETLTICTSIGEGKYASRAKGKMTVDAIEYELLYGEKDRIFVLNEIKYGTWNEMYEEFSTTPNWEIYGWATYMRFLRALGDRYLIDNQDGFSYLIMDAHASF